MSASNLQKHSSGRDAAGRGILFREGIGDRLRRNALGLAWGLKPGRAGGFLPGLSRIIGDALAGRCELPDPEAALAQPEGLCGLARDLEPATLLAAYRRSLYPFAHVGPYKWWSPAERNVLFFDEFHMQKLVRRLMRNKGFTVTFDRAFDEVVAACAERRAGKYHLTWIRPQIMHAFARLHDLGHAHSFEVWNDKGELAGGGYGLALGNVFFTESLFSRERDTSKLGFAVLNYHLAHWGFVLNDAKAPAPTLQAQGFRLIPRAEFRHLLDAHGAALERIGPWQATADLKEVAAWQPGAKRARAAA